MNNGDAWDVLIVLRWIGWRPGPHDVAVSDATALDALARLVTAAATATDADITTGQLVDAFEACCIRLRGTPEAEQVCEALAEHYRHGGRIPWPSIVKPFEAWADARTEASP